MIKKEQLFALIKSLSKTEKRYFKLFASVNNTDANYLLLFEAIDSQLEYDEKAIKGKFCNKKFIKQLHTTKNYLNRLILKSLRNYHARISIDAELKDTLREIEILYRKELYDQCRSVILKAEKTARSFENQYAIIEVLNWKRKLFLTKQGKFNNQTQLYKIISDEKEVIENLLLYNSYWKHTINVFNYFGMGKKELNKILKDPLLKEEKIAKTMQNKILFYHLQYSFAIAQNNINEAEINLDNLIAIIEKHPAKINDDPHSYITVLNNKIGLYLNIKNYNGIPPLLKKVRDVPHKYQFKDESKITFKLLLRTYNVELEMYRDTENIKKGTELIDKVKGFIKDNESSISSDYKCLIYYQFANIYFMDKKYNESLKWINKIIGGEIVKGREDIESYARYLNLIIHYELNNIYVLRYSVEATRRFLKKKRELKDFEKILLKFFSRLSTQHREKHKELFFCLNKELFANTTQEQKNNILDYLNFKKWINEKHKYL